MYVMYVCMHVCMYVFIYLIIYLFMHLRVYLPILVAFAHSVRKQFRTKDMDPNPTPTILFYRYVTEPNETRNNQSCNAAGRE